jgi:hypothetical protein
LLRFTDIFVAESGRGFGGGGGGGGGGGAQSIADMKETNKSSIANWLYPPKKPENPTFGVFDLFELSGFFGFL